MSTSVIGVIRDAVGNEKRVAQLEIVCDENGQALPQGLNRIMLKVTSTICITLKKIS